MKQNVLKFSEDGKTVIGVNDSDITHITLPDSVTSIGYGAFSRCSSLKSIHIPDSVTSIGYWAFYKCISLESIDIPDNVTSIGYSAFGSCSSLKEVHLHHKHPNDISVDDDTFDETSYDNCILFIPSGSRWKYRHHPVFGKFEHIEIE